MKINIADIITVQGATKKVSIIEQKLDTLKTFSPTKIKLSKPIQLEGTLEIGRNSIYLSGILTTQVIIPCDRCLSDVIYPIKAEVAESFGQNHLEDDEEEKPIVDSEIDLSSTVVETILLSLPMKVLCDEHCKGICMVCGQNLNEQSCDCDLEYTDPRLEKFKSLFQTNTQDESNKEV